MKKILMLPCLLFATASIFLGCDGDGKPFCDVPDPANQLLWLRDTIADLKASDQDVIIFMGDYKGQKVFSFTICCPVCDYYVPPNLYTCTGRKIKDADFSIYSSTTVIYQKEDSQCSYISH